MKEDFHAELSDVSEDPEGKDSGSEDDEEDMNLDSQMGDTGDSSEVVGKKSWDKDEDDDPKTSTEKYDSGSSVKGTEKNDRELRAKDDGSVEEEDHMEMDNDEQGKSNDFEDEPITNEETDLNTEEVMDKADAYDDRTGPELPEPDNDSKDIDMERQEPDEEDADHEDIGSEEVEQGDQRSDDSDDMELGDMAQHGDSGVDNEGDHVEDANTEPSNIDKQQLDKIDSLKHPSQGQPENMQVDNNRESEENLANSSDMNGAVAPSVNFSGNEVPNMEISLPNSGDDSRLSNSKPDVQNEAPQSHIKQANPFRSIGDAMEDWKERARVSADTQDHPPDSGHHSDDENATQFRYVPEGEQSTSQALGAATADQISDETQIKHSFMEDESHVKKLEQSEERTPDNPEVPHIQASQALTSKSENVNELEDPEIQTDTPVQDLVEVGKYSSFQNLVSFKRSLADDKIAPDDLTVDMELCTQMDLDIPDAETERAIVGWKNLELATMKLSQELAEQLRLVMEPTLASKLQGDYRTGKRINMKKVLYFQ
jgi:midasin